MDVLSYIVAGTGVTLGVLSGGATFFNKQRYTTFIQQLQEGNDELRKQISDLRLERTDCDSKIADLKARADEREKAIKRLQARPDISNITKLLGTQHNEVIKQLADITKILASKKK